MDTSVLFFEFEEVFVISVALILLLMYLFYVKYPVDKEAVFEEDKQK